MIQVKHCKLLYTHTMDEIKDILKKVEERLKTKNFFQVIFEFLKLCFKS